MVPELPKTFVDIVNEHPEIKQYLDQQESEIKYLKSRKKYGLVWEEEKTEEYNVKDGRLPVLNEISTKRISSEKGQDSVLIEGDNLHALSILNYTHKSKIDVICIDPPYNTGSDTWKYNNKFIKKEDKYRHSKWISFMSVRLRLAKKLLKKSGIIICSIDDYEVHNLGLLMDEIFGEKNRLSTVIVINKPSGRTSDNFIGTSHEYFLIYANNFEHTKIGLFELTEDQKSEYKFKDDFSNYKWRDFLRTGGLSTPKERPNSVYPIYYDEKTNKISLKKFKSAIEILPIDSKGNTRVWRQTRPSFLKLLQKNEIQITKNNKKFKVSIKDRLKKGMKPKTVWMDSKYDAANHGTKLLEKILGKARMFDFPKSIHTIYDMLYITAKSNPNSIILDFFAGSGTTGHAVLELNKEDDGKRKFILCTNNEGNICTDVCHPRLQNVMKGYKFNGKKKTQLVKFKITRSSLKNNNIEELFEETESNNKNKFDGFEVEVIKNEAILYGIVKTDEKMPGLNGNLKYYKIEQIEKEPESKKADPPLITDANKRRIINKVTGMLCVKEWCFDLLHENKSSLPKFEIYENSAGKYMGIIYDSSSTVQFIKKIDSIDKIGKIHTYVFSEIMSTILRKNNKVKFESIPVEILEIWNRIFESNICRRSVK